MLDSMYKTMSISSGLYPNLDLWNANKLQLQLQLLTSCMLGKVMQIQLCQINVAFELVMFTFSAYCF